MKSRLTKRVLLASLGVALIAVVAACGGGDGSSGRETSAGLGAGDAIGWTPTAVTFSMNPGGRQDVPATFTTNTALSNARVIVAPELRTFVTATPTSLTLSAGQSATVTLTFAPGAGEALRLAKGTVRVAAGTSTIAKPLPVNLTLVAPELINGVAVPPEPPPELNNATLAGFDTNGNGVRDDIERLIATKWPSGFAEGMAVASEIQLLLSQHGSTIDTSLRSRSFCALAQNKIDENIILPSLLNTDARFNAYIDNVGLPQIHRCG